MIYGYARVSSKEQARKYGLDVQRKQLEEAGCDAIYAESYTGTTMDRPEWNRLIADISDGDTLITCKLDRIARTTVGGCETVQALLDRGVSVRILNMGLIEDTPVGRMMVAVMFAMAQMERDLIVERTSAGREEARKRPGYREGRKPVDVDPRAFKAVKARYDRGEISGRGAARELGISESTWRRRIA